MDKNNVDKPAEKSEDAPSYITIRFSSFGSALFDIQLMNVTAGQVFAAAKTMELQGEMQFVREYQAKLQREAEQNLAKPAQKILRPQ